MLKIAQAVSTIRKFEPHVLSDDLAEIDFDSLKDSTLNMLSSMITGVVVNEAGSSTKESLCKRFEQLKIVSPISPMIVGGLVDGAVGGLDDGAVGGSVGDIDQPNASNDYSWDDRREYNLLFNNTDPEPDDGNDIDWSAEHNILFGSSPENVVVPARERVRRRLTFD